MDLFDGPLVMLFVVGGAAGSLIGTGAARRLSEHKDALETFLAVLIFSVAAFMLWQSVAA